MSEEKGEEIVRIGRKGKKKFAIGDSAPFELDVVVVYNQWSDIDSGFRDEKGEVPAAAINDYNSAIYGFFKEVLKKAGVELTEQPTLAEAFEFRKLLTDQVHKLQDFFIPESQKERSSPESTEVTFST